MSKWDVSLVTNMRDMFSGATAMIDTNKPPNA